MQADSRSRPTAESCNAAIAVKENTSDSKSAKITKFLFLDFASYVGVEGVALALAETNNPKFKTCLVISNNSVLTQVK